MNPRRSAAPGWARSGPLALALFVTGCGAPSPLEQAGVTLGPPPGWEPADPKGTAVPGTPLAAWTGPQGSRLVVFRSLRTPRGEAKAIAEEQARRVENLPEMRVVARGVEGRGGREAARVEVVAPGTGGALAPSGRGRPEATKGRALVPTRGVSLAFPRPDDTLWLSWHYPETAHAEVAPQVEATLGTLKLRANAPAASSY
jgi:hypothetical protein